MKTPRLRIVAGRQEGRYACTADRAMPNDMPASTACGLYCARVVAPGRREHPGAVRIWGVGADESRVGAAPRYRGRIVPLYRGVHSHNL